MLSGFYIRRLTSTLQQVLHLPSLVWESPHILVSRVSHSLYVSLFLSRSSSLLESYLYTHLILIYFYLQFVSFFFVTLLIYFPSLL